MCIVQSKFSLLLVPDFTKAEYNVWPNTTRNSFYVPYSFLSRMSSRQSSDKIEL